MSGYHAFSPGGSLEIVCGPMYSGKSEELIRRIRRAQIARQKVQVFKPAIDNRFHESDVVSRTSLSVEALPVQEAREILPQVQDTTRLVGIDEVQFFEADIIEVLTKLVRRGMRVVCAGLDQYQNGDPFGPMPELLALADRVDKIQAICTVCGSPASKTHFQGDPKKETLGPALSHRFQARCRAHHDGDEQDKDSLFYTSML